MPCYHPLDGWLAKEPHFKSGKYGVVFSHGDAQLDRPMKIACGQCIGCRLERSRQWAMRCVHEASCHADNSFITLTYNDENLPTTSSLDKRAFQLFMKKLRSHNPDKTIRFFMCGEYGENQDLSTTKTLLGRPHYHAIIFGHAFERGELYSGKDGNKIYKSPELEKHWPYGFSTVGDCTFETAAYVARYIMKKINGDEADEHYEHYDTATGEVIQRLPEFTMMSRRPGIAREWFNQFRTDLDKGFITMRGIKMPPPKYYWKVYEEVDSATYADLKRERECHIDYDDPETFQDRLTVKEKLKLKRTKTLKRAIK